MTNSPKTETLVPDEASTSLATSRGHSVGIPMDPSITAVAQGQVEGAWSINALGDDWTPEGVFILPEGEAMQVNKGTAIRVQSTDGWHHCEFPQAGVLHGPVVWAMAEAASEQDLLDSLENRDEWPAIAGFFVGMFSFGVLMLFHEAYLHSSAWSLLYRLGAVFMSFGTALGAAFGVGYLVRSLMNRLSPRTISSVDRRVSKTLRIPRSVLIALGAPQPHLKLVAPKLPMDDLDQEIQAHLKSYRAQRAQLSARKAASGPLVEHAATMIDEIETRLKAGTSALREDSLRQSYLVLIQRAEADILKLLHRQEAEEAEGVVRDMSALIKQMDRHQV